MAKQSDEERKAKARERAKAWARANPDRMKERGAEWRAKNTERHRAQQAEYRAANPTPPSDKRRAHSREYYQKRKLIDPAYVEHKREYAKEYRKANREAVDARNEEWRKQNPAKVKAMRDAANYNRRARDKQAGKVNAEDVRTVRARGNCEACGEIHPRMEVDHVIPLSRGGTNHLSNLQLLCSPCNRSKASKTMQEWGGRVSYETGPTV